MGLRGRRVVVGSVNPRKNAAVARKKLETAAADTNTIALIDGFQAQIITSLSTRSAKINTILID